MKTFLQLSDIRTVISHTCFYNESDVPEASMFFIEYIGDDIEDFDSILGWHYDADTKTLEEVEDVQTLINKYKTDDQSLINSRLSTCAGCENFFQEDGKSFCKECGCNLDVKVTLADSSCIIGKW